MLVNGLDKKPRLNILVDYKIANLGFDFRNSAKHDELSNAVLVAQSILAPLGNANCKYKFKSK